MTLELLEPLGHAPVPVEICAAPPATVRVLHVINGEHYSGAERVQDLLAQCLPADGFEVGFACLKSGRFDALRQSQRSPLFNLSMRSRFDLRPVRKLVKLIRQYDYRIVHTHTARSALVGRMAARICGVRHVHHVHSPTSRDTARRFTNRVNMGIEWLSLRGADAIVAVSHSLGEYVRQQNLCKGLLRVVPNGVPSPPALQARPTPTDHWMLGTVALFRPRKGIEVLLESLAALRQRGLDVRLRAVGAFETQDYEREIKSLATKLNVSEAINWVGFTADVPAELLRMDIMVLPSLFGEGLPMVVLEAMAAGVPVVATRIEGVPEAIRESIDGLLSEPGDAADLADCIADIVEGRSDWQELRTNAYDRQTNRFSDHSMAAGVAEVYQSILAGARGGRQSDSRYDLYIESTPAAIPTPDPATETSIHLLGTRIDNLTMDEAIAAITQLLKPQASSIKPRASQVSFVNADCINLTYRNPEYQQVLDQSDLVFADGIGMKIAGRALGHRVRDNVNGTDLFPRLCKALVGSERRLYLLGGGPGIAEAVARWVTMHFPGVQVCGVRDGYFQPHEEAAVVQEIADSDADLLLVALGAPRQDQWIAQHRNDLGCKVAMGVGGLFDFYSKRIPRAPYWMRKRGLEWCYRLWQEPRRLAKRYLIGNPLFLARLAKEVTGFRRDAK
jgi:exopolysaccharide biosynthesis WecB/TagA/CpsF family protein